MEFKNLTITRDGPVATVTLNRPDKLNALSVELMEEIRVCAERFREDVHTRVVIFAGAGKHFSAGADLTDPARAELQNAPLIQRRPSRIQKERQRPMVSRPTKDANSLWPCS